MTQETTKTDAATAKGQKAYDHDDDDLKDDDEEEEFVFTDQFHQQQGFADKTRRPAERVFPFGSITSYVCVNRQSRYLN